MQEILPWIAQAWSYILVPLLIFVLAFIALLWLRGMLLHRLQSRVRTSARPLMEVLLNSVRRPSILWCLISSLYLAAVVSMLPILWKSITGKILWSLFFISLALTAFNLAFGLVKYYVSRVGLPARVIRTALNVIRAATIIITILVLMDIWGVHTTPFLLLIGIIVLAGGLALRDAIPNVAAGMQLAANKQIKIGDYLKLESGEEGRVIETSWRDTHIETINRTQIIVPNTQLVQHKFVNYGQPMSKATEPFHFASRTHLTELTGMKARNLNELRDVLKKAPDAVVYYHTHHFLEEHQYLVPEPSNDFALWVDDALGDPVLSERLASIDTFAFNSLAALRDRLTGILDEYLIEERHSREALPEEEFYFLKSVTVVTPTQYVAYNLREFLEALRQISAGCLYFHVFESRLRLGRGNNDFSVWVEKSLGEKELAEEIARLDPYTYTLEGLRLALIQRIEKHIRPTSKTTSRL